MRVLMIFLDGIGLGADDPLCNPFAVANTPTLHSLAGGKRWLASTGRQEGQRARFLPTDPRLGVAGRPQSGTGQATIFTGKNVPALLGKHYGPKPDKATRALLARDNLFSHIVARGKTAALLEAYPPGWHQAVASGRRLRSSYQLAAHVAGLRLFGHEDLVHGAALHVDWTGEGWRSQPDFPRAPGPGAREAGEQLVALARSYDFSLFAHWPSDVIGHRGTLAEGVALLERFDDVMAGVLSTWDDREGLVIICSDHGNMEEIGNRRHTCNDVPTVVIGQQRGLFDEDFRTLADIAPRVMQLLFSSNTDLSGH